MKFKKSLVSIAILLTTSILVVALLTGFTFELIDIQLHDTYYVLDAFTAIVLLTILLLLINIALPISLLRNRQTLRFICVIATGLVLSIPVMVLYLKAMVFFSGDN